MISHLTHSQHYRSAPLMTGVITRLLAALLFASLPVVAQTNGSVISPNFTSPGAILIKPGADTTTAIQMQSTTGTEILLLDSTNARVGVGTSTASNRLVVGSDATGPTAAPGSSISIGNATGTSVLTLGQDTANRMYLGWNYNITPSLAYVSLGSLGTQSLAIQPAGGYVGIGTPTPAYTLDVRGSASVAGGLILNYVRYGVAHTLASTDYLVAFSAAPLALTLPGSGANPRGG